MERVDHVDVRQIHRGGFVGEVDGVGQGKVPDREGLEFRIAGFDAALAVVIELGQAGRKLAASRAGGRDDDELTGGFDVVVLSVSLVADDQANVGRVAFDRIMPENLDAEIGEAVDERVGGRLTGIVRDHDAADVKTALAERVHKPQSVHVIGDAEVGAHFVLFDGDRGYDDDDLRLVRQLEQHVDLAVGLEAGEDAGGVVIVEELAAEFQIQFVPELGQAFADALGLQGEVLLIVKAFSEHDETPVGKISYYYNINRRKRQGV